MSCFPCFSSQKSKKSTSNKRENASSDDNVNESRPPEPIRQRPNTSENQSVANNHTEYKGNTLLVKTFTFRELATATKNFRQECLLGEGGFGRVYKGIVQSTGQMLAVKQLDKHGLHANKEFQVEVAALCQLQHPNLVKLIGYCADGDQRLLVYEFVSGRSLEDHLLDMKPNEQLMDWTTRMKIAYGAAQGLEYLHEKVDPPIVYRDLKASNILLDGELSPKLSDFGLHRLGPGTGDKMPLSSRVMGTYGYCAPEYSRGGNPTIKSDVYSFGVVLLELITGRRAVDTTKPCDEQNLVSWAQTFFKDPKRYPDMADPRLKKNFPERGLNQAVAIASMCLQEEAAARPLISDVMVALSFLSISTEDGIPTAVPILSFRDKSMSLALSRHASCSTPSLAPESEKEQQSTGLDETRSVNEDKGEEEDDQGDDDEGSATDSDDGSGSESDGNQGDKEEASSGKSSSDSESDDDKKDKGGEAFHFGTSGKSNSESRKSEKSKFDSESNGDQEDKEEESSHFGINIGKSNLESRKSGKSNLDSESDSDQERKGEEASHFGKSGKCSKFYSESESDGDQEYEEASGLGKSGKSDIILSFGSERRSVDNKITVSCSQTNSSSSSEEEIESLSRKESRKSNEESTSSRYGSEKVESLSYVSGRTNSQVLRDDESNLMRYSRSSKHDDQRVSSDDSDDDNNGFSHSKKSGVQNDFS